MARVICPHCGSENPKSLIVTTCQNCLQSLEGAQPAREGPAEALPAEPAAETESPEPVGAVEAPADAEPPTPAEAEVAPPSWTPPPPPVLPPPDPTAPTEAPPAQPALPPVVGEPLVYQPPSAAPPATDAVMRELKRGFGQSRGCCIGIAVAIPAVIVMTLVGGILASALGWGGLIPVLFIAAVVLAIAVGVAVFVIRAYIAASFYDVKVDAAPAAVGLGDTFNWGVVVRAKRPMIVGTVTITLKCQEHAIARGGTSDSHYRQTLHEQSLEVPGQALQPGEEVPFRAAMVVPPNAIPSYSSRNNFVEWTLEVRAPVPGYCPDIKDRADLSVRPSMGPEHSAGLPDDEHVPADWLRAAPVRGDRPQLGHAWGALQSQDGAGSEETPVMAVGGTRQLYLWVQTQEEVGCRGVWCWVGCRIHGRGTDEEIEVIPEYQIHQGPLVPGQPIGCPLQVSVPASGPVTFVGRYVKLEWVARVRFDIPMWFDKRMWVPFIVTPQRLPGPDRD